MNIAVAQSGGPSCAINASLVGVFEEALRFEEIGTIYGSCNGIEGIIQDRVIDLKTVLHTKNDLELLMQTPATALGSCRYKMPDFTEHPEIYQAIERCFQRYHIGCFFYIGGNDSMDTVVKLSRYFAQKQEDIRIIGIPKTIDNDLFFTDHTPGFGSAAKYLAVTLQEIVRDSAAYNLDSVTIVEIMGRHAGWLTASSCLLHAIGNQAPHLIYVPEAEFSLEKFLNDVREAKKQTSSVIVAVSEAVSFAEEEVDSHSCSRATDAFGHKYLNGIGKRLEEIVRSQIGCKVRSIELNVMQRCSSHLASKTDLEEAMQIGAAAVRAAMNGETGKMMGFVRVSNTPYAVRIQTVDAAQVANAEHFLPREWINETQNNITDDAIPYFLPLIQGELTLKTENGLPKHILFPL